MSDFDASGLANLQILIDSYTVHAIGDTEPPTLMEIAGFPHWENVYSNILGFLLNTKGAHGFGPLFIRSIVAAYRSYCPIGGLDPERVEATDRVEREVSTATNKRIDLLIECADFLICIENKIRHGLHNDLREYREHCEKSGDGRPVLGIVLSPHSVTDQRRLQDHHFVSITYGDLVKQVRQRMGSHIGPHNTQYQYLLFDFLDQTSRFARTTTMNDDQRAFLDFWQENDEKISNIQLMCKEMRDELNAKAKAQAHIDQCLERLTEPERKIFKTWIYDGSVSVFDLAGGGYIDGCGIHLDVEFHPLRVTHTLGKRRGREPTALASQISANCGIRFDSSSRADSRPKNVTKQSPFEASVCKKAVDDSVALLKEIARMSLADRKIHPEA